MNKVLSVLLSLLLVAGLSFAEDKQKTAQNLIDSSGKRSTQKVKEQQIDKVIKKAVEAYAKGGQVLFLLTHGKVDEAKKLLAELKKEVAELEKEYKGKLERLPIEVRVIEVSGITDLKEAERLAKEAKKAVNENDFITARFILNSLRDEIVIETVYLPIKLFREAVVLADKFLQENKVKDAIAQLQVALGLIEIDTTIIPKPLAIASLLVEDASKVFEKDPKTALQLLEEAKRQIKLAKVLGYVRTEEEIKPLIEQIEKLEEQIKNKTGKKESFKKLFRSIEEMKEKATQTK
ncbi:MAG: YfdX family protein [Aquificae bacterium]|nr:YfdX family protein [Aquificota bacterium]